MKSIEEMLVEYKESKSCEKISEAKMEQTVITSKMAFFETEQEKTLSYPQFLFEQLAYIRKRWWIYQLIMLGILWRFVSFSESNVYIQRSMGVFASVFIIMIVPELWKNRSFNSMEVEGAAFYSLRQIYAARMLLFAMADVFILSIFVGVVSFTTKITIVEMLIQFILPLMVNCCICFLTLCSRYFSSEYFAIFFSTLWSAVWIFIIWRENMYNGIIIPVWLGVIGFTVMFLLFTVYKVLKSCENYWEVNSLWN